jgi:hypothetical protein
MGEVFISRSSASSLSSGLLTPGATQLGVAIIVDFSVALWANLEVDA